MDKSKDKRKKKVIDLRRFLEPEMSVVDEDGSYTGITKEMLKNEPDAMPVQDADDL